MRFVGWIPGKRQNRRKLRQLGVRGHMLWSNQRTKYGVGAFSYCEIDENVMERLIKEWGLPNPSSFTAIDEWGNSQPRRVQKEWYAKWHEYEEELEASQTKNGLIGPVPG